nr:hypothetical protein [Methylobacterium nodulans]
MRSDDGAHSFWLAVVAVEEILGGLEQRVDALEQLAVRDLTPEVTPEHLNRVQPGTVGREIQQNEAPSRAAQDGFDLLILVRAGVVPGHVHRLAAVARQQRLEQLSYFTPSLVRPGEDQAQSKS